MTKIPNWNELYINMARLVAQKSRDTSTKCGCIITGPDNEVRSTGYNGLPRGVEYKTERTEVRPEKYLWYEHAERNAIYNAARMGISLKGCSIYITGHPCADCAKAIIQSGIISVFVPLDTTKCDIHNKPEWIESCIVAKHMFMEAGVLFKEIPDNGERDE
jgi:dCMP deaminase